MSVSCQSGSMSDELVSGEQAEMGMQAKALSDCADAILEKNGIFPTPELRERMETVLRVLKDRVQQDDVPTVIKYKEWKKKDALHVTCYYKEVTSGRMLS